MNTEQLRKIVLKATPGPWRYQRDGFIWTEVLAANDTVVANSETCDDETLEFIAAANPATILALLECVDALRAFPGFTDDANVGDAWIENKRAALQKLDTRLDTLLDTL